MATGLKSDGDFLILPKRMGRESLLALRTGRRKIHSQCLNFWIESWNTTSCTNSSSSLDKFLKKDLIINSSLWPKVYKTATKPSCSMGIILCLRCPGRFSLGLEIMNLLLFWLRRLFDICLGLLLIVWWNQLWKCPLVSRRALGLEAWNQFPLPKVKGEKPSGLLDLFNDHSNPPG